MDKTSALYFVVLMGVFINTIAAISLPASTEAEVASDVQVDCNSDYIVVNINTRSGRFNGMVYPRGLSKNSTCLWEWVQKPAPIRYTLPLRGCNTMSTELDTGEIEYFNTIVVQPHLKLVTNQGRGFHIRCRYNTRNNTVMVNNPLKVDLMAAHPLIASAAMPGCSMRIFSGDPDKKEVAENVKIGDPLTLVITLDKQDIYGLRVTDCIVRDGLDWGEQKLLNKEGCPVDPEIMGIFKYSEDKTTASVKFQAHKFPYTPSVYYQCNVKLCLKANGGCDNLPLNCKNRLRRQANDASNPTTKGEGIPATIEVYSGLYVNEANDVSKDSEGDSIFSEKASEESICISQRSFAIGICIAGLVLILLVLIAALCLLTKRRKKTTSHSGSSIYSGPYTNTAYSHSS